jgi:hypothetical protein
MMHIGSHLFLFRTCPLGGKLLRSFLSHLDRVVHQQLVDKCGHNDRIPRSVNETPFAVVGRNVLAHQHRKGKSWHRKFVRVKIALSRADGGIGQPINFFSFSYQKPQRSVLREGVLAHEVLSELLLKRPEIDGSGAVVIPGMDRPPPKYARSEVGQRRNIDLRNSRSVINLGRIRWRRYVGGSRGQDGVQLECPIFSETIP